MSAVLAVLVLLYVPAMLIYTAAGNLNDGIGSLTSTKALALTSMGNLGEGKTICGEAHENGGLEGSDLELKCSAGTIERIALADINVGEVEGFCGGVCLE